MNYFFSITHNKKISAAIFLIVMMLSSMVGTVAPIICIDQEEVHALDGHFQLAGCHTTKTILSENILHPEFLSISEGGHDMPCIDIFLNTGASSVFSHQIKKHLETVVLDAFSPVSLSLLTVNLSHIAVKEKSHRDPLASWINLLKTVVLLV